MKQLVPTALIFALVSFIGAGTEAADPAGEEGGLAAAGRNVPFAALERDCPSPAGRLEQYCSARMIRDLLADGDTLWIGTEGGLFAYCISRDSIVSAPAPIPGSIEAIAVDDAGSLWVGGSNGLGIRSGSGWRCCTAGANPFFSRIKDISPGDGRVWIASYGRGAGVVGGRDLTIYAREDSLIDDRVTRVLEQERERIWFGTASGMCRADTVRWESMRFGSGFPIGSVNDILIDEEGNIFVAVARHGVAVYNLGRVRRFGLGRGLPERDVAGFSLDPLGKVWAAGSAGVSVFDGSSWTPYRLPGVPMGRYDFLSIHHGMDGECYLGTDEGRIVILAEETVKEVALPQSFPEQTVSRLRMHGGSLYAVGVDRLYRLGGKGDIIEPPGSHFSGTMTDVWAGEGGELWVSSRFGLLRRKGSAWEVFDRRQGLPTEQFNRIARDGDGHLWFGTCDRGVLRLTGESWVHYSSSSGLPGDRIADLLVDRHGDCWVLTEAGRVARFDGERWEELPLPAQDGETGPEADTARTHEPFVRFISPPGGGTDQRGAYNASVLGLDGLGDCMVAGDRGIYRFTGSNWQVIEPPEGVSPLDATSLLGTTRGAIWVGTEGKGIFIRNRKGWSRLGVAQGLSDDHIESLCEDSSGNIWIGTRFGGLSRFSPGSALD